MKLPENEIAFNRAAFKAMSIPEKAEYLFAYYKLPLVIAGIVLVALASVVHRAVTHKDAVLYAAFCNIVPDEDSEALLTAGFLDRMGSDPARTEVACYRELYITTDDSMQNHQYAYASKLKIMGAIDGERLDVVLMNREAYDLLSGWGYLLDLGEVCADGARPEMAAALVENTVLISDNRIEVELGEADEYVAETMTAFNAVDVSIASPFAGFSRNDAVFIGVIANTPRLATSLDYIEYVLGLS